ncbi:MAG: methyltransferase domain-containing protein [Pseudomonadota bacterium]|nr:methyltransferase domain-containing protein [Pseudomonadota bacterium]MEC8664683.1 methyltransferase domain-containing protein [Pseudomonadota bacterium]
MSKTLMAMLQYDSWSSQYDDQFMRQNKYAAPREAFNAVAARTDVARSNLRMLDVGCGTGLLSEEFRRANPDAFIAGIDLSNGMLREFRKKNVANELVQGSITGRLPFHDASFDLAASTGVFELITRPANVIAEMSRVVRKDGLVAFTSPHNWFDRPNTLEKYTPSLTALANWIDRGRSHREAYMEHAMRSSGIEPVETRQFIGYQKNGGKAPYQLYIGRKLDKS